MTTQSLNKLFITIILGVTALSMIGVIVWFSTSQMQSLAEQRRVESEQKRDIEIDAYVNEVIDAHFTQKAIDNMRDVSISNNQTKYNECVQSKYKLCGLYSEQELYYSYFCQEEDITSQCQNTLKQSISFEVESYINSVERISKISLTESHNNSREFEKRKTIVEANMKAIVDSKGTIDPESMSWR